MGSNFANNIHILVADSDDRNRKFVTNMLELRGFQITQAIDGGTAIKVIEEDNVDLALFEYNMKPRSGLDIARHIILENYKIGMIMMVEEITTNILMEAGKFEIGQVMDKPIDPDKLGEIVRRTLKASGKNPDIISSRRSATLTREQIMERVLALAEQNARAKMGGPFAAIVVDEENRVVGEGVNGVEIRCDPTAHAEVMAIRRAAEKRRSHRLEGCKIYCSSEPTMLGEALIIGTGIEKVYYSLTHAEVGGKPLHEDSILDEIAMPIEQRRVSHVQLMHDQALDIFKEWQDNKAQ